MDFEMVELLAFEKAFSVVDHWADGPVASRDVW